MRHAIVAGLAGSALLAVLPAALHADPPTRVARVSYLAGDASIRHGTATEWMPFVINYPVTTGDVLWTDSGARTELHIGSTALRLAERTSLEFTTLEDNRVALSLTQGAVNMRVRELDHDDELLIETLMGMISIERPGAYRVETDEHGNTTSVYVRAGKVRVETARDSFDVHEGQAVFLTGGDRPSFDLRDIPREDDFDAWSADRDHREDQSVSERYVSRDMTGYEELDGNGRWVESAEFGPVWVPVGVREGWAPYRYGYWAWVNPWGWTWIDDAPWGFAPFHYGRWVRYERAWVWVPGPRVRRPVYAPALVAFVGGGGWSVSMHFGAGGGVAWFPLAPGEPWVPTYHASNTYVQNVNITNVHVTNINVTNVDVRNIHYRNLKEDGAVTAVSRETFVAARPMRGAAVALAPRELRTVEVVGHAPPVTPRRESEVLRVEGRSNPVAPPPRATSAVPMRPLPRTMPVAPVRAIEQRQLREDTKLQERHEQERTAPRAPGVTTATLRAREESERQAQEARHASERATATGAPAPPPAKAPPPPKAKTPPPRQPDAKQGEKPKEHGKPPQR